VEGYKEGLDINHIDGNKQNNHYTNLEWCSRKHNIQHSFRLGISSVEGAAIKNRKAVINIKTGEIYKSIKDACEATDMKIMTLSSQLNGIYRSKTDLRFLK